MGHNLDQLGTASLDTFGGLITNANPSDLPEGSSPRCWDVDYIVGSVFTRPGLKSVYVYTETISISQVSIVYGVGTFTFSGKAPLINEELALSGFTDSLSFLNGMTVVVTFVDPSNSTFLAEVDHADIGPISGLNGTAASTTGNFTGPNIPGSATVITSAGNAWINPTGILGDTTYASTSTGGEGIVPKVPTNAANLSGVNAWTSPSNIFATSATVSTVALSGTALSGQIRAKGIGFDVPEDATITGISTSFSAKFTGAPGTGSINIQLADNLGPVGTAVNVPISNTTATYTQGSNLYQWGTELTSDLVNGNLFSILVQASLASGSATFTANTLQVTLYYTQASSSEVLQAKVFNFSIPSTSGVSGFAFTFEAFSSAATTVSLQLLKAGLPVGDPRTQVLNTTPTIYTVGAKNDLWGSTWLFSDINATDWGVQIVGSGLGTTSVRDLDALVYLTPGLENFNYVKSYIQNDGQIDTLALDAAGIMWKEDATNFPGTLVIALTGILPGTFAKSVTFNDREFILFSDLNIGTDRPRTFDGSQFLPLTQVGPGAPPSFVSSIGNSGNVLQITGFQITSNVVTFTYTGTEPTAGQLYVFDGLVPTYLNGVVGTVLGTGLSPTQFQIDFTHANDGPFTGLTGTATLTYSYTVQSITQDTFHTAFSVVLQSAGPGSTIPGSVLTVYYSVATPDHDLVKAFHSGLPVYVYLSNFAFASAGTYLVTSIGQAQPPGLDHQRYYFTVNLGASGYNNSGDTHPAGRYQRSLATLTSTTPVVGLVAGDTFNLSNVTPSQWNGTWPVVQALQSSLMNITSTAMSATGTGTYGFNIVNGVPPVAGEIVTITNCTNSIIFNTTGVIASVAGAFFTIDGFTGYPTGGIPQAVETQGVAQTFGTQFTFDPGATTIGTATNPIFGNAGSGGHITIVGGTITPIGAGIRQAVVFFITESGYETAPSPPVIFTTTAEANFINATNIPIGPPDTIARGIAFTEAGQNGVPGANFYVIMDPVQITVGNTTVTYTSTVIRDNISTTAKFTFTDAILLSSREIDIQGDNLFNLIELGSSAWAVPYAARMFYGLQLNKVQNFNNLSFDGGYLPNPGGSIQPLGWNIDSASALTNGQPVDVTAYSVSGGIVTLFVNNQYSQGQLVTFDGFVSATFLNGQFLNVLSTGLTPTQFQVSFSTADQSMTADSGNVTSVASGATLIDSPVTGMAYYIDDAIEGITTQAAIISQTAFQDAYQVPIILPNVAYSVRVAASNPSGNHEGTLVIDLTDNNPGTGFGKTYGSFSVPLSDMTSNMAVFSGTLLTTPFTQSVSPNLNLRVYVANMGFGSDVLLDRIEVFPTLEPYLTTQVYGSYVRQPEALDASGDGGIIDTSLENAQACMGAFVMHDVMYIMKTKSMYSTTDNPQSEPGGWSLKEVSNLVGTCGINAYDVGEEWVVMACRNGIYGFNGGQPVKIMQELWNLWETINWDAGNTIVLRNDIVNKRILCAIPLPTGIHPVTRVETKTVKWLPNAPYNPSPTTPNVILMLNYQGFATFEEMVSGPQVHTTMFGTLASQDMRRKWSIWQIPTPYMDFIYQQNGIDQPLYVCNGIDSSKIYLFDDDQLSDDGVAINGLYVTYGFVDAVKAATLPIFGLHTKRYTILQMNTSGQGTEKVRIIPNTLDARYPYTVPGGISLTETIQDDVFRPVNAKGNRVYVEVSTNAVGERFNLSKVMLTGKADPWSSLNPTGGGSKGIV